MLSKKKSVIKYLIAGLVIVIVSLYLFTYLSPPSISELNKNTFAKLNRLRGSKEKAILDYLNESAQNAKGIAEDKTMLNYFFANYNIDFNSNTIVNELDNHFIRNYYSYFDILFINKDGFIFNSIKQEQDFHKNLFSGELSKTLLAKKLEANKNIQFVEYEYYFPSNEFAAFFPVPIERNNVFYGWIVLQLPLNAINSILLDRKELGKTGEIYLVNEEKHLLTESRFIEEAAIKKIEINTVAVSKALQNIFAEEIIKDYRGINVYSSFSKIEFLGTDMIIIAEIDEDEVLTNYFLKNADYYLEKVTEPYNRKSVRGVSFINDSTISKRVDINEYSKTHGDKVLYTKGVSTCSAVIIFRPNKFGYLSHISPLDKTYYPNYFMELITEFSLKYLYNTETTDFLKEITQRVVYYEVLPSQLYSLELVFVANH
jgi:hypothetical protein